MVFRRTIIISHLGPYPVALSTILYPHKKQKTIIIQNNLFRWSVELIVTHDTTETTPGLL
jgi:hypothetical protein